MIKSLTDLKSVEAYLSRIGAEPRSLKTAVVRENHGSYWRDVAVIRFAKDGTVSTDDEFLPTENEAIGIKGEWASVDWPELKKLDRIVDPPKMIKEAKEKDVFEFRGLDGKIIMVQVRIEKKGEKSYVPWTYWTDDMWRCCEPDGDLPLYNAHRLKEASTVFIHEGAKAARRIQELVDSATIEDRKALENHPWGRELSGAVHLGWIGGALSPGRTDWRPLALEGISRAYIVADNDKPGLSAIPKIAFALRIPTYAINFTGEFPPSFDLGDDFPERMFSENGFYVGPSFRDCLVFATWATDMVTPPRGRPAAVLRENFRGSWVYVAEADVFVCKEMPEMIRTEQILNKVLAPFSHVANTAHLIAKAYEGQHVRMAYRPDISESTVISKGTNAINLYVPPRITPREGDAGMWLEFMSYMFPNEEERKHVLRWCATLIAKPETKMGYGLLLISERQGIGKTTLGSHILAPIIGMWNVGFPSENDINGAFNDWVANRRLAVVGEIYSGSSWKAYNALKGIITDRDITVNQKYQRPYRIDNWCHIIACSNSMRALKMENDDRRWFYPEITENPWPPEKFTKLREWIDGGGLNIIKSWALKFGDYVLPNERAPMTERKREMIEGSRSEAQREAAALAEAALRRGEGIGLGMKDIVEWCRNSSAEKMWDTDYELRKTMVEVGMIKFEKRVLVGNRLQFVLMTPELKDEVSRIEDERERTGLVRERVIRASDLLASSM